MIPFSTGHTKKFFEGLGKEVFLTFGFDLTVFPFLAERVLDVGKTSKTLKAPGIHKRRPTCNLVGSEIPLTRLRFSSSTPYTVAIR